MKLYDRIRREFVSGEIVTQGRLPTLRVLAGRYGCGVATVKRAFDQLERDGLIRVVRGLGTFAVGSKEAPSKKKSKLIGAILLDGAFLSELESVKDEYLKAGWLFSIYNATRDHQSPEKERLFLKNAQEQNFASFIVVASPYEPVNSELFLRLRSDGCKVIHLAPYLEDMSGECCFYTDFERAGSLAVLKIALAGYRSVFYIEREVTAPHVSMVWRGIESTMRDTDLTLAGRILVHHKETDSIVPAIQSLPERTAILCFDTELGEIVQWCCKRLGYGIPERFGLASVLSVFGVNASHSHIRSDISTWVRDVLAYATDERRHPLENVQKFYRGDFIDCGTLRRT